MNIHVGLPVTMAAMLVFFTCLTVAAASEKVSTDVDIALMKRLDIMSEEIREARHAMERATQETRIARLETEKARLETDEIRSILEADNATIRLDSLAMKQQMDDLQADTRHEFDPDKVVFSVVSHKQAGPVNGDTKIEYEIIYTNIGDGWKPNINAFQAPVDGFYVVSASVRSHFDASGSTICHIVHTDSVGSTTIASMYGGFGDHNGAESGMANSVIIKLERDDYVSVQLDGSHSGSLTFSEAGQVYSTFSGFLLFTGA